MRTLRLLFCSSLAAQLPAWSIAPALIEKLALGEYDDKITAITELLAADDESALDFLQALHDGAVQVAGGKQVLIVKDGAGIDAISGKSVTPLPEEREDVMVNNRLRRELASAIAALKLASQNRDTRMAAAKALQNGADEDLLPLISKALAKESDTDVGNLLILLAATLQLQSKDTATRLAAVQSARLQRQSQHQRRCCSACWKERRGYAGGPDAAVRAEAQSSLKAVESRLSRAIAPARFSPAQSLGFDPAARRARTCDHLRPDGRDQHGARGIDHGRRLQRVRGAKPVPRACAGPVRLVSRRGRSGGIRGSRPGRHGARTQRDPLPLRPAAGNPARHLGHQPDPDPVGAHAVRRAERAGRKSGVDVRRHHHHEQHRAAL
jgi:hypothetical protein